MCETCSKDNITRTSMKAIDDMKTIEQKVVNEKRNASCVRKRNNMRKSLSCERKRNLGFAIWIT